jgi:hypothetical protein
MDVQRRVKQDWRPAAGSGGAAAAVVTTVKCRETKCVGAAGAPALYIDSAPAGATLLGINRSARTG